MLMVLKHLGFFALPITNGFNISPMALHANNTVTHCFANFPPLQASPFTPSVLYGKVLKNNPVSSALNTSSGLYSGTKVPSLDRNSSSTDWSTSALSPQILKNPIENLVQLSSQPFESLNSTRSRLSANSKAFSWMIGPLNGMFLVLKPLVY